MDTQEAKCCTWGVVTLGKRGKREAIFILLLSVQSDIVYCRHIHTVSATMGM